MNKKLKTFLHILGLGSLGQAVFVQGYVLFKILLDGYILGVEHNIAILCWEVIMSLIAAAYLLYIGNKAVRETE